MREISSLSDPNILNMTLKFLGYYVPNEFKEILNGVQNNTLTRLIITPNLIEKFCARSGNVYSVLDENWQHSCFQQQIRLLGEALEQNTSVNAVEISGYFFSSLDWISVIIDAFRANKTIQDLVIEVNSTCMSDVRKCLAVMLEVNTGLKNLRIGSQLCERYSSSFFSNIVKALKVNKTLEILGINNPHELDINATRVLSVLPKFNHTLKKIELYNYGENLTLEHKPMRALINRSWLIRNERGLFRHFPDFVIDKIESYLEEDKMFQPQDFENVRYQP